MSKMIDVSRLIMALPGMPEHDLWRLSDAASKELTHRPRPEGRPSLYELLRRERTPIRWEEVVMPDELAAYRERRKG